MAPDAELVPFMQSAIDRLARLGFNIAGSQMMGYRSTWTRT